MESALNYSRKMLKRYNLRAKKSLGQNFLIADNVIENIIRASGLGADEQVLEIGPGIGALTRKLAQSAEHVWAVELDESLVELLQEEFKDAQNIEIIHADALKFSIRGLGKDKIRLIANLPYYITSPLLKHFLRQREQLKSLTIMVQEEVARRIVANPGSKDYGVLSLAVQAFCDARILFTVPPNSFLPAPKVTSAVVQLNILTDPLIDERNEEGFFRIVRSAFAQRRKNVLNSLANTSGFDKNRLAEALSRAKLDPGLRAENLSLQDFIHLTQCLNS